MSNKRRNSWFSLQPQGQPTPKSKPHANERGTRLGRSTLDWEFGAEEKAIGRQGGAARLHPQPSIPSQEAPYRPTRATPIDAVPAAASPSRPVVEQLPTDANARRAMATRMAMDEALDRWWTDGALPSLALLRDGLLLLEAGHTLDEAHCSFLLRVALRRQRGMITALRYQHDADRTAFLIKDALLDPKHPLPPRLLVDLQQEDKQSAIWMDYLLHDLAYEAGVAQGQRRQLAARALVQLRQRIWLAPTVATATEVRIMQLPLSHRWSVRWLLWAFLILSIVLGYVGLRRTVYAQSVHIPGGSYTISDPPNEGRVRTVVVNPFRIDLTEVTNGAYQRCVANDNCTPPSSVASATRSYYFTNAAYATFPVVNVDWDQADTYCTWLGKRLPTREEWEVAASVAPLTQRHFRYPWGDRFEPKFVNGGSDGSRDTRAVGDFHPVGDSSFGLRDVAGNVAEWTASPSAEQFNDFIVKGGSYRDSAELLRLDVQEDWVRTTTAPWLGFRCAGD